jgi:dethiobiotin synthetase
MAAEVLGEPAVRLGDLVAELTWPAGVEVGLVETAGGVRSPLAVDGDAVALTTVLQPDLVVLVADAQLGAINAVRSSLDALSTPAAGDCPIVVFLNRFDADVEVQARNVRWLTGESALVVETDLVALGARVAELTRAKVDP